MTANARQRDSGRMGFSPCCQSRAGVRLHGLKPILQVLGQAPIVLAFVLIACLSPELGIQFARRFLRPAAASRDKRKEPPMRKRAEHTHKSHAGAKHPRGYESVGLTREVWRVVRQFRNVAPSEEAFYLKLQALPARKRGTLRRWWHLKDDWALFARLCRFWGVGRKPTRADRAERATWELDDRQLRFPFAQEQAA